MKKLALTTLLVVVGLFSSSTASAQLSLNAGFDSQFEAPYLGVGYLLNNQIHLTGEVGFGADQYILKGDLEFRAASFRESEIDLFFGLGAGRTFESIESVYPSNMYEALISVHYHQFYVGYAFGLYEPTDPKLSGMGDYHYFKVGVLLWE